MSRPLIRSGQWSKTTTGITQPAARLSETWGKHGRNIETWETLETWVGETWGHDTFMCGLDFLNLDLR